MAVERERQTISLKEKRPEYQKRSKSLKKKKLRNGFVRLKKELNTKKLVTRFMLRRRMAYLK
jgi:hypothetical protein